MKLPWKKNRRIVELEEEKQELQEKIGKLEEEKESFKNRFQAERDRRSNISAEKQEAEEKIKKLEQKLENSREETVEEDEPVKERVERGLSVLEARGVLEKLGSVHSESDELASIYCPESVSKLSDVQGLKGSISRENYEFISQDNSFVAFLDEDFIGVKLKARPFFSSEWSLSNGFDVETLLSFIGKRKKWAVVSAGDTKIFEEEGGEIVSTEEISSRVDSKQKKGGFSQGRFERKRQEQIDEHLDLVEVKGVDEDTLLVGEEKLCKRVSGRYLGGFDSERSEIDALYNFRLILK